MKTKTNNIERSGALDQLIDDAFSGDVSEFDVARLRRNVRRKTSASTRKSNMISSLVAVAACALFVVGAAALLTNEPMPSQDVADSDITVEWVDGAVKLAYADGSPVQEVELGTDPRNPARSVRANGQGLVSDAVAAPGTVVFYRAK